MGHGFLIVLIPKPTISSTTEHSPSSDHACVRARRKGTLPLLAAAAAAAALLGFVFLESQIPNLILRPGSVSPPPTFVISCLDLPGTTLG